MLFPSKRNRAAAATAFGAKAPLQFLGFVVEKNDRDDASSRVTDARPVRSSKSGAARSAPSRLARRSFRCSARGAPRYFGMSEFARAGGPFLLPGAPGI